MVVVACFGSSAAWAAAQKFEQVTLAPSALRQMRTLEAIKAAKTPAQAKIDGRLFLANLKLKNDPSLAPLTDFRFVKPDVTGRVDVDIILAGPAGVKPVIEKITSLGDVVRGKSAAFRRISASVKLQNLEAIAALADVRRIRQRMPYIKHKVNTSEGDATHDAFIGRGFYGVTGVGVKIGVISDGVDSLASLQASGDLPPVVQVLPGQDGSGDEGSAMLEIVHDLAPGASLAFATADPDEAQFAQNILDLAAAGCNIIVDDIIYLDESPFQDGPVAQAVNTVTSAGVLYFSSAGNEGNKNDLTSGTWEGDFLGNGTPAALAGLGTAHDFGDGGQSILIESAFFDPPVLIWAEHFDLSTGLASTDFDLYDLDGTLTTVFDASTDTQDGVGGDDFPVEAIIGGSLTGERLVVMRFTPGSTSSVPMFNLILFRGELDDTLATSGATRGHSSAADAFSVAATPVGPSFDGISSPGPYPGVFTGANTSEDFTSDGPRRVILSPTGVELTPGNRMSTGGVVRQKPDITAADGVSTAAPGFNPFYGTSAAAPHAAAIAALLKSAVPSLTPAQIRTHLISTAIDIELAGVDRDTGAGIVMARAALQAAGATPAAFLLPQPFIATQVIGDGDGFVENNEIFNLTIPLTNSGGVTATGISAVLTSLTPGVVVNAGASTYADLAPSATGNNVLPFTFTVGPSVACGATITFNLVVTYASPNSPATFPITMRVGQPGAPVTVSFTGPPVAIPDGGNLVGTLPGAPVNASINVAAIPGNVWDIDLRIDGSACNTNAGSTTVGLDHTFVNDLELTLRSPLGTTALVVNNIDDDSNNFCQTLLDDESAGGSIQGVVAADAPFTGSFKPNVPLSVFDAEGINGTWQLQAQDFFVGDTGSIRAYSLIITPTVCNAPALTANVTGTKTVSGTFRVGSTVTYTVTLTNNGGLAQADNGTNEFIDVLPPQLTLVNATASSGTPVATIGTNTVTWNGSLAAINGSVTITITATINAVPPATVVSNQGTINYDSDGNGSNEASRSTDDPGVGGTSDPTSFTVLGATVTGTKTVSGTFTVGGTVTYTVTLTNSGNAPTADNPGNEFTDTLPVGLTLVNATASSGTPATNIPARTVTWNGGIAAGGSVTITITATINSGTGGTTLTNQGSFSYDSNGDGTNESNGVTDDPGVAGPANGTGFAVAGTATDSVTKSVTGSFTVGSNVTYTVTITNTGTIASNDSPGNELTDVLPSQLTLVSASASSGTAVATVGTNTVTWNGSVPAAGSVTITITATIHSVPSGTVITNTATLFYDSNGDTVNDTTVTSNAAAFTVIDQVPTLSEIGLIVLALGIVLAAVKVMKG